MDLNARQYNFQFYADHSVYSVTGLCMPKISVGLRKFSHHPFKVFPRHRNSEILLGFKSVLAHSKRLDLWSGVNKWGAHLAQSFFNFKRSVRI